MRVETEGKTIREGKVASAPEALTDRLSSVGVSLDWDVSLLSQCHYAGLRQAGIAAELSETRHVVHSRSCR